MFLWALTSLQVINLLADEQHKQEADWMNDSKIKKFIFLYFCCPQARNENENDIHFFFLNSNKKYNEKVIFAVYKILFSIVVDRVENETKERSI